MSAKEVKFGVDTLDHDAVVERSKFHAILLVFMLCCAVIGTRHL